MSGSSQDGGGGIFTLIANHISAVKRAKTICERREEDRERAHGRKKVNPRASARRLLLFCYPGDRPRRRWLPLSNNALQHRLRVERIVGGWRVRGARLDDRRRCIELVADHRQRSPGERRQFRLLARLRFLSEFM